MPVLKFETKIVNGKPNIVYDPEKLDKASKKKDYKLKNQKYPLRNNETTESNKHNSYSHHNNPESDFYAKKKFNNFHNKEDNKNGRTSIISTPDPNSQSRITSNKNLKLTKPFKDKENLFNLLDQNPNIKKKETKSKANQDEISEKQRSKSDSLTESDIDEIMKQVVLENKNLLSEEQLVDVLAKLYLDAKISQKKKVIERHKQSESHSKDDHLKLSNSKDNHHSKHDEISKLDSIHLDKQPDTIHVTKTLNPVAPLTAVQKKQLQWEKERREMAEIASYNPWGKPGCGAPTKSPMDGVFKNDNHIIQKDLPDSTRHMKSDYHTVGNFRSMNQQDISQAELKRQQWIMELNEQVAEKERRKWIDNNPVKSHSDITEMRDTKNVEPDLNSHGRGKGLADLNQMSTEEIMQKRLKQMEQQEAIRKQIEEKELQKRLDREHKAKLDQQEDARLFREKQQLDTQFLSETARIRQRDDESGKRLAQQRAQLEAAERAALLDKKLKRLQKLEMAGHDTRQLRAGFLADQIPGNRDESIDLKGDSNTFSKHTFEKFPESWSAINSPSLYGRMGLTEDQSVQTENNINKPYQYRPMDDFHTHESHINYKDETQRPQKYNKSANAYTNDKLMKHNSTYKRPLSASSVKHKLSHKIRKPEPIESRKPWGVKKQSKKYVPQSKRDPFYFTSQESRENHKQERVNHIIAQVKANHDRIPDREVHDGRSSQRHKRCDTQRRYDNDKENYEINHDTYDLKNNSRIVLDNEDRVQASVRYKDTYKQPMKTNQTYREEPESNKSVRPTESITNWWSDPNHEIVRTTDVLDPAMADLKLPFSRENTGREKARQGYYKNLNPAQFGEPLETQPANHNTNFIRDGDKRNAFYQPEGYPTQRQNTILKQLSDFREGLLLKQKEIETSLSMNADL